MKNKLLRLILISTVGTSGCYKIHKEMTEIQGRKVVTYKSIHNKLFWRYSKSKKYEYDDNGNIRSVCILKRKDIRPCKNCIVEQKKIWVKCLKTKLILYKENGKVEKKEVTHNPKVCSCPAFINY